MRNVIIINSFIKKQYTILLKEYRVGEGIPGLLGSALIPKGMSTSIYDIVVLIPIGVIISSATSHMPTILNLILVGIRILKCEEGTIGTWRRWISVLRLTIVTI